jgi:hypothetical protein
MTRCKLFKYLSAVLFLIPFAAPSYGIDVRPAVKIGAEFGGDNLVTVGTTGSSGSGSESLKAGEGIFLGAGASILSDAKDLEFEITLNYKFSSITKGNGDVDWSVVPLDMLVFYRIPHWRSAAASLTTADPQGIGLASGSGREVQGRARARGATRLCSERPARLALHRCELQGEQHTRHLGRCRGPEPPTRRARPPSASYSSLVLTPDTAAGRKGTDSRVRALACRRWPSRLGCGNPTSRSRPVRPVLVGATTPAGTWSRP